MSGQDKNSGRSLHRGRPPSLSPRAGGEVEPGRRSGPAEVEGGDDDEPLAERVERLEAELVDAEAAVERKRQEDGP